MDERHIWSVKELNTTINGILTGIPALRRILVRGEVSNCKRNSISGHWYFSLKEGKTKRDEYLVNCMIWSDVADSMDYLPKNGEQVILTASLGMYVKGGTYQLYVTGVEPDGVGDKQRAREELMAKLKQLGYFDADRKKPLPRYPQRVGVVTSETGDAVRDVIATLKGRWPLAKVVLLPVFVQGDRAPADIAGAILYANQWHVADVLIVGRGGGSLEDLDVFDDERIARAIYNSRIPVVTAVGHTKNVTIADLVADRSTITPTQAGQAVSPDSRKVMEDVDGWQIRLALAVDQLLKGCSHHLEWLAEGSALRNPEIYINAKTDKLERAAKGLSDAGLWYTSKRSAQLGALAAKLDALSPLAVLGRGYAIAEKDGAVLRAAADVREGDKINVRLSGGSLDCLVEEVHNDGRDHDV